MAYVLRPTDDGRLTMVGPIRSARQAERERLAWAEAFPDRGAVFVVASYREAKEACQAES